MGILRNGLNLLNVSSDWQQTVIGMVIIAAILWEKGGKTLIMKNNGYENKESIE
jgi:ribose/xylose/arabinose/galactoside ABC-type transport system permease subunit